MLYFAYMSVNEMGLKVEVCTSGEGLYDIDIISSKSKKQPNKSDKLKDRLFVDIKRYCLYSKRTGFEHFESASSLHKFYMSSNLK